MISYVTGGGLADRFPPRRLMGIALFSTAAGGIVLLSDPSFSTLCLLYGYWGFTTIFLPWAAMIKATRIWGGHQKQGLAYGLLDGGRGAVAFLFGAMGVLAFSVLEEKTENLQNLSAAYDRVIIAFCFIIIVVGVLTIFFLKVNENNAARDGHSKRVIKDYLNVLKIRNVWLLMIIVLCAYTGYKVTDVYSLYANEVMGYSQLEAAKLGSNMLAVRIIIGVAAGLLADQSRPKLIMITAFLIAIVGSLVFAAGLATIEQTVFFWSGILFTAVGTYALRALYFATMQECKIPLAVTGTAVGLISLVGYTPDIFMGLLMGYYLDNFSGITGFQWVFGFLAGFSIIGLICTYFLKTK